jgi:hypothetical protein
VRNLFEKFRAVAFNSQIYLLSLRNGSSQVFEIYRKFSDDRLTVAELCRAGQLGCPRHSFIWERRSNLTGANFTIGVAPQSTLIKSNRVNRFSSFDGQPQVPRSG